MLLILLAWHMYSSTFTLENIEFCSPDLSIAYNTLKKLHSM